MKHNEAVNRLFCESDDPLSDFDPYDWEWWDLIMLATQELEGLEACESPFIQACECAKFYYPNTNAFKRKLEATKQYYQQIVLRMETFEAITNGPRFLVQIVRGQPVRFIELSGD